jgi:hypothetical protein
MKRGEDIVEITNRRLDAKTKTRQAQEPMPRRNPKDGQDQ